MYKDWSNLFWRVNRLTSGRSGLLVCLLNSGRTSAKIAAKNLLDASQKKVRALLVYAATPIRKGRCVESTAWGKQTRCGDLISSWSSCSKLSPWKARTVNAWKRCPNATVCVSILIISAYQFENSTCFWQITFRNLVRFNFAPRFSAYLIIIIIIIIIIWLGNTVAMSHLTKVIQTQKGMLCCEYARWMCRISWITSSLELREITVWELKLLLLLFYLLACIVGDVYRLFLNENFSAAETSKEIKPEMKNESGYQFLKFHYHLKSCRDRWGCFHLNFWSKCVKI